MIKRGKKSIFVLIIILMILNSILIFGQNHDGGPDLEGSGTEDITFNEEDAIQKLHEGLQLEEGSASVPMPAGKSVTLTQGNYNGLTVGGGTAVSVSKDTGITASYVTLPGESEPINNVQDFKANPDGSYSWTDAITGKAKSTNVQNSVPTSTGGQEFSQAEKVETNTGGWTPSNYNVDMQNSRNVRLDSQGRPLRIGETQNMRISNSRSTITLINAKGVEFSPIKLTIESADSVNNLGSTATFVKNYTLPYEEQKFTVHKADQVIIGNKVFNNVGAVSEFYIENNKLKKAHVVSSVDENYIQVPADLSNIGELIVIKADTGKSFNYETVQEQQKKGIKLELDPKVTATFYDEHSDEIFQLQYLDEKSNFNLEKKQAYFEKNKVITKIGLPLAIVPEYEEKKASLTILENKPAFFKLSNGKLTYINKDFNESIETQGVTYAEIDENLGVGYIILAPAQSPGGRYEYNDKHLPEGSFAIYNPSKEPYEVGFKKTGSFFTEIQFETIKDGSAWGYVDFVEKNIQLHGQVQYERYGYEKISQLLLQALLRPMYLGYDNNNVAEIKLGINKINIDEINIVNSIASPLIKAITYQGNHIIIEEGDNRYERIDPLNTVIDIVQEYKNSWIDNNIIFKDGTLTQNKKVIVYNTESNAQTEFEKSILLHPTFDQFKRGELFDMSKW